jgi:type I restriction enzyme M protein
MLDSDLKSKIDKVWNSFWTGGLSNPITVIEQMTYLLFIKRLDELQTQKEQKSAFLKKPVQDPIYTKEQNEIRWSFFKNNDPEVMYKLFTKENGVFDFMKNLGEQ